MKKYKLFAFTFIIAILSMVTVNAREMTASELGQAAIDQYKSSDQDVGYIYVIGEYAFTSQYDIKTEDIMLAAKSIDIKGQDPVKYSTGTTLTEAYKKMVINTIRAQVDDDFNISGWEISDAAVGTSNITENQKINIRFIDYVFQPETSEANIKFDKETEEAYKNYLTKDFGIENVSALYADTLTYADGKLTGLMLKYEITKGFSEEDKTGYYLPFVIEVPGLTQNTTVTIKEDKEVTATYDNFDIKENEENKIPGIAVIWSIPGENGSRTITIIVDIDGENNNEYEPTTYTIDYTGLEFQGESKVKDIKLDSASEEDKKTLKEEWGYDSTKNKSVDGEEGQPILTAVENQLNTYKLKGTLVEQKLKDDVYGASEADGYYFDFTILLENNSEKNAVVKAKVGKNGQEKTFQQSEFDNQGNLTILQRIDKNSECVKNKETNNDECKINLTIDLDGDEDKYFPSTYIIDFSEVTFEKSSLVEMSNVSLESFDEHWKGFEENDGYSTTFNTDGNVVKVTGLITIFDNNGWSDSNPFEPGAYDYYLAFKLKKSEATGETINETVKFLTVGSGDGEQNEITNDDFGSNDEIYVLKYINPFKENTTKKFTIEIDLDGDGKDYAPYVLTIDWSELDFQIESRNTEVKPLVEVETTDKNSPQYIEEQDKKQVQSWGYNFEINKGSNFIVESSGTKTSKLTGSIKEQTLNSSAGFKNSKGYFLLVKIYGPTADKLKETVLDTDDGTKKWTIKLQDEEGNWKDTITPDETDYENGFITVLFRLDDQDKKVLYQIDWDGDGEYFLPHEETITYEDLTFTPTQEVKINGKKEENVSIYVGEPIPTEILTKLKEEQNETVKEELKPYRELAYFTSSNGTMIEDNTLVTEDMISDGFLNLTSHWNLYSDKFVNAVLEDLNKIEDSKSDNFSTEFVIEDYVENSGEIIINVINPDVKVSRMNETSIPGTIAHILLSDEIKEITLTTGTETETFTKGDANDKDNLKSDIQNKIKNLYSTILSTNFDGKDDENVTLSLLAQNETYKKFTLEFDLEDIAENVTLAKAPVENGISLASEIDVPTKYTFTFKSSVVKVDNEENLKLALANPETETIYIEKDFDISSKINIERAVLINGNDKTLTSKVENDSIFNIKHSGVSIENITIKDAKPVAITIESGDLTTKQVKIDSNDGINAGIEVKNGATLNASNMTFESEDYEKPLVKAEKNNAIVNLTDKDSTQASRITKEKIIISDTSSDSKQYDDTYNYYNYYNDQVHSKIFTISIFDHETAWRKEYKKYGIYNQKINMPNSDINRYTTPFNYDGEKYTFVGVSENRGHTIVEDKEDDTLPDDVIKKEDFTATKDAIYWVVFKVKDLDGVSRVSTKEEFTAKLNDSETHTIYIKEGSTIDFSDEVITINKNLSIIGSNKNMPIIKAKKIVTTSTAKDVSINRVNLQIAPESQQNSLIEINGEKLSLWQSALANTNKDNNVDYALYYKNSKSIIDVRWMGAGSKGFTPDGINKAYIYVESGLAAGTNVYGNTFKKSETNGPKSFILINGFADDAEITEDDESPDIIFEANTYTTDYAIEITKSASNGKADISIGGSSEVKIGLHYTTESPTENYSNIKVYTSDINKIKSIFIDDAGQPTEEIPEGVTNISLISKIANIIQ